MALTPGQEIAAVRLGNGANVTAAGRAVGVSRETIYRWLHDAEFAAAVDRATRARLASIRRQGVKRLAPIVRALEGIVLDGERAVETATGETVTIPKAKDSDRIAAADRLLKMHGLMRDGVEITGSNGGPVRIATADDLASADEATLRAIASAANREPDAEPA